MGCSWPCLHEFLAIVTHPAIFAPATPFAIALDRVDAWLESLSLMLLTEMSGYWIQLHGTIQKGQVVGPQIHDSRIATLCHLHGVRELWTADRHFGRFPGLVVRNPLVE